MNTKLRKTLLALQQADHDMRTRLVEEGRLFDGYVKDMEAVHVRNAEQLEAIIDEVGWPGRILVGEDGAKAAWLVAQHAIGLPAFQRKCLKLIRQAVKQGDMPALTEAYLTDRVQFNQRLPQIYGTIYDWDKDGEMSPWPIEDSETIEYRRQEVGLPPLEEHIQKMRDSARDEGNQPPVSYESRQQEIKAWATKVGWIES